MHFDTESNEYYYWHKASSTASWERPGLEESTQENVSPQESEGKGKGSKPQVSSEGRGNTDGPEPGQQRVSGRIAQWQGFFGWITPLQDLGEDLRPLLERNNNLIYVSKRDLQPGLSTQVGQKVDFQIYTDENGVAALEVRGLEEGPAKAAGKSGKTNSIPGKSSKAPSPAVAKGGPVLRDGPANVAGKSGKKNALPGKSSKAPSPAVAKGGPVFRDAEVFPDGLDGETAAAAADEPVDQAAAKSDDADLTEGPLLPGWEQVWCDVNQCYYYWHANTKQSCWERPAVPVAAGTGGRTTSAGTGQAQLDESLDESAANSTTSTTPFTSQAGREMTPSTSTVSKGKGKCKGKGFGSTIETGPSEQSAGCRVAQTAPTPRGPGWKGGAGNPAAAAAAGEEHGAP